MPQASTKGKNWWTRQRQNPLTATGDTSTPWEEASTTIHPTDTMEQDKGDKTPFTNATNYANIGGNANTSHTSTTTNTAGSDQTSPQIGNSTKMLQPDPDSEQFYKNRKATTTPAEAPKGRKKDLY